VYYALLNARLLMLVLMTTATVLVITTDLLRLRRNPFKHFFIVLFGSQLRRREFDSLTGGSYLFLAALVSMLIFGSRPGVFIAAISFLIVGDTAAAVVGLSFGRVRFFRKTLEGTLACLAACLLVAWVVSSLKGLDLRLRDGILGAVSASIVEAMPVEVNDNVVVPIVSGAVMMVASFIP
jgi:dolichol kinase